MSGNLLQKIRTRKARLCVVGLGYVGLPTAIYFARTGFKVTGCDVKEDVVKTLKAGRNPLPDLNLDSLIEEVVNKHLLSATTQISSSVRGSDVITIVVPTPTKEGFEPDLRYIMAAGRSIAEGLRKGQLVVLESTVYPGVTEDVLKPILEESGLKAGSDFGLAYCPERYNPGDSEHFINMVVRLVAGVSKDSTDLAAELYRSITKVHKVRDIRTAEMAKIIENTQRDLNIALVNEIALICERMNLDAMEVIKAAATKWNFVPYYPGGGVGGHCLPKDPWYLVKAAEKANYHAQIITAGRRLNDYMPQHVFHLLQRGLNRAGKSVSHSRVAILGLSYKENIGDTRNSPSLLLSSLIREMKGEALSVDPYVSNSTARREFGIKKHFSSIRYVRNADALVIMTSHMEFRKMDLPAVAARQNRNPVIVDARRILDPGTAKSSGFRYLGVGFGAQQ